MKENDNCENELDDVDAEMDDEKEFAKKSYNRTKDDAKADRDYRLGKRFPIKEDFSDDTEILWRKGSISIIKDGYGFGIDNGININRFTIKAKIGGVPVVFDGSSCKYFNNRFYICKAQ